MSAVSRQPSAVSRQLRAKSVGSCFDDKVRVERLWSTLNKGQKVKVSVMKKFTLFVFFSVVSAVSHADDFENMFSDDPFADVDIESISANDSVFSLSHEVGFTSIVNVNSDKASATESLYSGVTSAQLSYKPSFSFSPTDPLSFNGEFLLASDGIFWLRAEDNWSEEDIENRQYQADVKELTAQYRLSKWQLSTGVQSVTLGLADALSVSNVLYAQDLSIPGAKDLDDTVIPAWTTLASGAVGSVRVKAGVIHAHQINKIPTDGTDFDTGMHAMLEAANLSLAAEPLALENAGVFASFSGVVGPLDWQFNAVSQLEHSPAVELGMTGMGPVPIALHFPRTTTLGVAGSYVAGSFLLKAEAALVDGLQAQALNGMLPGDMVDFQRAAGTAGFDFNHSSLGRVVGEIQYSQILNYDALNFLNTDENSVQWVLMYSKNFLRDSLTLTGQLIAFDIDASGGRLQGVTMEYAVNDQLTTALRYVDYVAGDFSFLNGADDRDRLIASIIYRF